MMNHAAQGSGNRVQEGVQVQLGNHGVVHFQQHAQPVALPRQLPLVGLRALEIQRVVHRDGHLPRHLLQERDFALGCVCGVLRPKLITPSRRCAVVSGSEQTDLTPFSRSVCSSAGNGVSFSISSRMKGCCVSQTQPEGVSPTGNSVPGRVFAGHFGFEDVQAHDVARGIVQDQVQVIEFHDAMQPLREFVEQLAEVAVLRDRFGHFQQRLVLRLRRSGGQFAGGNIVHRSENNTPVRRGSTQRLHR